MRRAAFDATVARAAEDSDGVLGKALAKVIALTAGDYIRQVIDTVLGKRAELARMVAYHQSRADWAEAESLALKRLFGVAEDEEEALIEQLAGVLTDDEIDAAIAAFAALRLDKKVGQGGRSQSCARRERAKARAARRRSTPVFLTRDGKPRAQVCSKGFANDGAGDRGHACRRASRVRRPQRQARASAPGRSERRGAGARRRGAGRLRAAQAGRGRARL